METRVRGVRVREGIASPPSPYSYTPISVKVQGMKEGER